MHCTIYSPYLSRVSAKEFPKAINFWEITAYNIGKKIDANCRKPRSPAAPKGAMEGSPKNSSGFTLSLRALTPMTNASRNRACDYCPIFHCEGIGVL